MIEMCHQLTCSANQMNIIMKVVLSTPLTPHSWEGLGGSWGAPPFPRQDVSCTSFYRNWEGNSGVIHYPHLPPYADVSLKSMPCFAESPERPDLSGGPPQAEGVPPEPILPPSPAGEGGQGDEVPILSSIVGTATSQPWGFLGKKPL